MALYSNWREIVKKAWSIRLMAVAAVMSAAEVIVPFFADALPRGAFAAISGLTVAGAFVARLVAQRDLS
jgi:hypothetical protein